jgi:D-beta-D-heptose 7-phosphate kinase/D-beta-D-heptose 1-phosphate adenosyltransferase
MITVLASGCFDCLHIGHLEYLRLAKRLGDYLIVAVDSDRKVYQKKGYIFIPEEQRAEIIRELKFVNEVNIIDIPVADALIDIRPNVFAKGGDRDLSTIPKEIEICNQYRIRIVTGLGDKKESSSNLINRIKGMKG